MHRVGVSAPDIAGADESNLPAPESFRSTVAYFESASGLFRPVPAASWLGPWGVWGSWIPACGEQQKHGVIAFKLGFYLPVLNAICDYFPVRGDLPLPPEPLAGRDRDLKQV